MIARPPRDYNARRVLPIDQEIHPRGASVTEAGSRWQNGTLGSRFDRFRPEMTAVEDERQDSWNMIGGQVD
jgi:hypothetical protein